jgi:anti-sigma regulatory factor (Ser/Thr protein kinase)
MTTSPTPDATGPLTGELVLDEPFSEADLQALRRTVAAHADRTRLPRGRVPDLVLIASELAANAIRHGGGKGRLRLWQTTDALVCQVTDHGPGLPEPHALPAQRPEPTVAGGRGLWLVLTYADAIAIRSGNGNGTSITATLRLDGADGRGR